MKPRNLAKAIESVDRTIELTEEKLGLLRRLRRRLRHGLVAHVPCPRPSCHARTEQPCYERGGFRDEPHKARVRAAKERRPR
jgi:hypothetical protein